MKAIILAALLVTSVAQAEDKLIVVPSDWEDYSYVEQETYKNEPMHPLRDETLSETINRYNYGVQDLQMKGYLLDIDK